MDARDGKSTDNGDGKRSILQVFVVIITSVMPLWVAIVGCIGALLVGLFSFPPFVDIFQPKPTPTPILTIEANPTITTFITSTTIAIEPFPTESIIASPIPTNVASPEISGVMYVVLTANQTRGRPPLDVTLDARDSYFISVDGTRYECGACTYTWQIRTGGDDIYGPEMTDGRLQYIFGGRGNYFVSVYVCRSGSDTECAGSGVEIIVE